MRGKVSGLPQEVRDVLTAKGHTDAKVVALPVHRYAWRDDVPGFWMTVVDLQTGIVVPQQRSEGWHALPKDEAVVRGWADHEAQVLLWPHQLTAIQRGKLL